MVRNAGGRMGTQTTDLRRGRSQVGAPGVGGNGHTHSEAAVGIWLLVSGGPSPLCFLLSAREARASALSHLQSNLRCCVTRGEINKPVLCSA